MRILITGAGGNMGRSLAPLLAAQGHTPLLMDIRPLEAPYDFIQADIREADAVRRAITGVDAIVHAAALHGIHQGKWSAQDFWDINVSGTFHLFEAARAQGIQRVVLCSTMGVYGQSAHRPPNTKAWNIVTEELPCLPTDGYGESKHLCEEMARYYARQAGITTVALRLGMFVPEPSLERYGFRLLFGGVDDRDAAQAALLALSHTPARNGFDFFNIMADVPFTVKDTETLGTDTASVLEQYYPDSIALFADRGINLSEYVWGRTLWSVEKAKRLLSWQPRYNFDGFVQALRNNDTTYYPFAGLPWWGV